MNMCRHKKRRDKDQIQIIPSLKPACVLFQIVWTLSEPAVIPKLHCIYMYSRMNFRQQDEQQQPHKYKKNPQKTDSIFRFDWLISFWLSNCAIYDQLSLQKRLKHLEFFVFFHHSLQQNKIFSVFYVLHN